MEDDRYMPSEVNLPPVVPETQEEPSDKDATSYYAEVSPELGLEKNVSVNELVREGVRKQPEVIEHKILTAADKGEPEALRQERRQEVRQDEAAQSNATQIGDIVAGAPLRQPGLQRFAPPSIAPPLSLDNQAAGKAPGNVYGQPRTSLYRKSILRGFVAGIIVLVCAAVVLLIA